MRRKTVKRRGQLALVGVILLASTLIALISLYELQPKVAYERGHLQAAQLVHLARACMASGGCTRDKLALLVQRLYQLNQTYQTMRVYVTYVVQAPNPGATSLKGEVITVTNATVFEIETLQTAFTGSTERVSVAVQTLCEPTGKVYSKQVGERTYKLVEVKVTYAHSYSSPFFNVTLCPSLRVLDGIVDAKRGGKCTWVVGAPLELSRHVSIGDVQAYRYDLRDEFGSPVAVLFRG